MGRFTRGRPRQIICKIHPATRSALLRNKKNLQGVDVTCKGPGGIYISEDLTALRYRMVKAAREKCPRCHTKDTYCI